MTSTTEPKKEGGLGETVKVILQAFLIAIVIRTFLFQPFNIPSGSMKETLLVGDYLFVSKFSYGYSRFSFPFSPPLFDGRLLGSTPNRGDVVVFKLPRDESTDYIKRVIGLPGDEIQMIDGVLHINGQGVQRVDAGYWMDDEGDGKVQRVKRWTPIYKVPPGHYFMMGDNRDNSTDSRVLSQVGYVPYENLVGRAQVIFFSVEEGEAAWQFWKWPWTVRWNRLLSFVR